MMEIKQSELKIFTERLILMREGPEDYLEVFRWSSDPRVVRYMLASPAKKPEDLLPWLDSLNRESETAFVMIIRSKSDQTAIGSVGLFYDEEEDFWDVAYTIRYDEWGKGYAYEAAKAMIDHAHMQYGAKRFRGECAVENRGSARVLEKLGMKYDHESSYSKHDGSATYISAVYTLLLDPASI